MRVLVTGGRDYTEKEPIWLALDYLHDRAAHLTLIQGGANGADEQARKWSWGREGVSLVTVPANWRKHGKSAGPLRNRAMLEQCKPQLVLAFPGGKGTASMVRIARAAGVPVVMVHSLASLARTKGRLGEVVELVKGQASGRVAEAGAV